MPDKKYRHIFILYIFLFSFVVRFIYLYFFSRDIIHIERSFFGDAAQYILIAKNIASGNGFNMLPESHFLANRAPLFPLILAGVFKLFGAGYWPARIFQVCISSLIPVITYFIGKEIAPKTFGERAATISACISIFYPFYVFYSAYVLTETLFVFLSCLSLLYLIRFIKTGSYRDSCLAGVFLGLSALTKPIALGFGLFFVVCYFFVPRRRPKGIVIILATMFLVILPWTIRNYVVFKKFVPITTEAGRVFYSGANPMNKTGGCIRHVDFTEPKETGTMGEVEASKYMFKKGLEFIRHNPVTFLKMSIKKAGRLWRVFPYWTSGFVNLKYKLISMFSYGLILPFFLVGIFLSIRNWKLVLPLYCLILYTSIFCMVFYGTMRFRLPIMPAVIILASIGIDKLIKNYKCQIANE